MAYSMAYNLMARVIDNAKKKGTLDRSEVMNKLDAFLAVDRLKTEEYKKLVAMMDSE